MNRQFTEENRVVKNHIKTNSISLVLRATNGNNRKIPFHADQTPKSYKSDNRQAMGKKELPSLLMEEGGQSF